MQLIICRQVGQAAFGDHASQAAAGNPSCEPCGKLRGINRLTVAGWRIAKLIFDVLGDSGGGQTDQQHEERRLNSHRTPQYKDSLAWRGIWRSAADASWQSPCKNIARRWTCE